MQLGRYSCSVLFAIIHRSVQPHLVTGPSFPHRWWFPSFFYPSASACAFLGEKGFVLDSSAERLKDATVAAVASENADAIAIICLLLQPLRLLLLIAPRAAAVLSVGDDAGYESAAAVFAAITAQRERTAEQHRQIGFFMSEEAPCLCAWMMPQCRQTLA